MSREKLFAAQFLAVAMFLLFLPGVTLSDRIVPVSDDGGPIFIRTADHDRAASSGPMRSSLLWDGTVKDVDRSSRSGSDSGSDSDAVIKVPSPAGEPLDVKSLDSEHHVSFSSGAMSGSSLWNGKVKDVDRDSGSGEGSGPDPGSGFGVTSPGPVENPLPVAITPIPLSGAPGDSGGAPGTSRSDPPITIPEPAAISLVVLGLAFLIVRRMMSLR